MELSNEDRDSLAGSVYNFLIEEGYHGHYPSAEEQADKFVADRLAGDVQQIVTRHVEAALSATADSIQERRDEAIRWSGGQFAPIPRDLSDADRLGWLDGLATAIRIVRVRAATT